MAKRNSQIAEEPTTVQAPAQPPSETAAAPHPATATATREPGEDAQAPKKKWTPLPDPLGFENHRAGGNRVRLLKSEAEGAWVIRFAKNPNEGPYSKENTHPVLKMLKEEGYRWGFDGGDGQGGWGKAWTNDPYGTDHIEARRVLAKAAEMLGATKEPERTPF